MTDFTQDDRFDGLYMNVAQQARGIEPLLDTVFSFLRRKTDFFDGPQGESTNAAFEKVKQVFDKHAKLYQQQKKQPKQQSKSAPAVSKKLKPTETVVEMGTDGGFDISSSVTTPAINIPAGEAAAQNSTTGRVPESSEPLAPDGSAAPAPAVPGDKTAAPIPTGNGGTVPGKYVWTQTLSEVTVSVVVPDGTRGRDLAVVIGKQHLSVALVKESNKIIHAPLTKSIVMDDSFWTVEDGNRLVLTLTKSNGMEWWSAVCQGDPEIDVQTIQPESSKLDELDGETRKTVEKMMYDQRQKALGLPTSDQKEKLAMLEKFKQQHPEMDFTNAKIN